MPDDIVERLPEDVLKLDEAYPGMCLADQVRAYGRQCARVTDTHVARLTELLTPKPAAEAVRAAIAERAPERAVALADMEARKDAAYLERNQCVALIARMALALGRKSGIARTAIEGWSDDWHGCVYIDLPTGQASWHFHDSQSHLFAGLPAYDGAWDGHDTPTKYERVAEAYTHPAPERAAVPEEPASGAWDGAEEWMPLAWELCADECGEEACNELVWEGGPIPEPWGERWLKYEGEAKRLIALVRKHVPMLAASPAQPAAAVPAQVVLADRQIEAVAQWLKMGNDSLGLAHQGYFSRGGWAYEELAALTPRPAAAPESAERQGGPNVGVEAAR